MSASMGIDVDNVSEISNGIDTLIDPIKNFFKQKLSLMKARTEFKIHVFDDDEELQSNWLLKQTS